MRIFLLCILVFFVSLGIILMVSYICVPVYNFAKNELFTGDKVYNPYQNIDSVNWRKANFHAHQSEKPQCNYTVGEMLEEYRKSGYDIASISDHQYLNFGDYARKAFIPTYEHGINFNKFHQLMINSDEVALRDFPVMISKSQVQFMMHYLKPRTELLVLNHPGQMEVVNRDVYRNLRGYDLLELNPERGHRKSTIFWDMALSEGIYSNLIANDDAHSITSRRSWFQRSYTMINTKSLSINDILTALRKGASYGVYIPSEVNIKPDAHANLPEISEVGYNDGVITISLSCPAATIQFIGQGGAVNKSVNNTVTASYIFDDRDTYVRIEATMAEGVILFSNPFVRTSGGQPTNIFTPDINWPLTILINLLWMSILIGLIRLNCILVKNIIRLKRPRVTDVGLATE